MSKSKTKFKSKTKTKIKLKTKLKALLHLHPLHYICMAITVALALTTAFIFNSCFIRIWESLCDFWNSLVYYVDELFELELGAVPTVNNFSSVPMSPMFGLPDSWEEFVVAWGKYWELFITADNFYGYMNIISLVLRILSPSITLLIVFALLIYLLFQKYLENYKDDERNYDSWPLKLFKRAADYTYIPAKRYIKMFLLFLQTDGAVYLKLWKFIWALNFNFFAVIIEFFAYYFYFTVSFDVFNIYRQIVKLFCDLSVVIKTIPGWLWTIIGIILFDKFRKSIGDKVLYHHEAMDCGFIRERPIASMWCGDMGKKKTTAIADVALLQNKMFRELALELMVKNELKFPNFPWQNLEWYLGKAIAEHKVYNLVTCKDFIRFWREHFEYAYLNPKKARRRRKDLRRSHGWPFRHNLLFDYNYQRYGLFYDDGLKRNYIWDVIQTYAEEYLIYTMPGNYILANFSIRTDTQCLDAGNLPLYNDDFYQRTSYDVEANSHYSHIINFNALRLGKKTKEDDPYSDSFEFGTIVITEIGKERQNNLQLQELKKKDVGANQKNDGFNDWLKMIRHSATVDYIPFVKVITDEQRPESWGADARDLLDIIHIRESSDNMLAMPFFALEELLYQFIFSKFINLRNQYKHVRNDNTVPMWLFRKITAKIYAYYSRIYNRYGFCRLTLDVERGTQDGEMKKKYYYLDHKRIYSDRFSTDCFSDFFETKARKSEIGLADYPEYQTVKASFDELGRQESYFVNDLIHKQEDLMKAEKTE